MDPLARALQNFFTEHGVAMRTDHAERLAARRRSRRIEAVPSSLRQAVRDYETHLLNCRARARRAGMLPRSDHTIATALATIRDRAVFVKDGRNKQDWLTIDVNDIETFLTNHPNNQPRRSSSSAGGGVGSPQGRADSDRPAVRSDWRMDL